MKRKLLLMMASLLLAGAVSAQTNYWGNDPDSHAQPSNTPIVASVQIDDVAVTINENMRLGAFVGNGLRGIAAPHTDGNFWIQVFYAAQTDNISFKFYDGETEYTTCATTLNGSDEGYGTPNEPVVLNFTTTQTQTTELAAGWTWWSTPVELSDMSNALQQLEACINQYGTRIQSQTTTVMKRGSVWVGSITLQNEQCYKIEVSNASTVSFTGVPANPSDHPISITTGWNWIGYPVSVSQTASVALSNDNDDFQPSANDVIMGQGGSAMYRAGQWFPNTYRFEPGVGYLYNSKATTSKTLVFVNGSRTELPQVVQEELFWKANIHKYENNMVVLAVVYIDNNEQRDENLELGAFVDGECTGNAKMFYVEEDNRYYAVLTVGANDGDRISFGLVDNKKGIVYNESSDDLFFSKNAIIGDFDDPYKIHFGSLGIGESTFMVAMHPNPVDRGQSFKLNIPQEEEVLDVTIVNALGAVIRHETGAFESSVTGLPVAGVYTIKVYCRSGNTYYGRLIVK